MAERQQSEEPNLVVNDSTTPPIPPRFWWLKRFLVAGAVLLVALVLLRIGWGWEANRRYRAAIDRYKTEGGPVYVQDFDAIADAVPPDDNAAVLYEKALDIMRPITPTGFGASLFRWEPDRIEQEFASAAQLVKVNRNVYTLVRGARAKDRCAWSTRLRDYLVDPTRLSHEQRTLVDLLSLAAECHFREGNPREAVSALRDAVALAGSISDNCTIVAIRTSHLAERSTIDVLQRWSGRIAVTNQLGDSKAASREQVTRLIASLLHDKRHRSNWTAAMLSERALCVSVHANRSEADVYGGQWTPCYVPRGFMRTVLAPILRLDALRTMEHYTSIADFASHESFYNVIAESEAIRVFEDTPIQRITRPISATNIDPTYEYKLCFKQLTRRRLAATALAAR